MLLLFYFCFINVYFDFSDLHFMKYMTYEFV